MDLYAAIEAKYGFAIPEDYRRMERDGFFDLKNDATYLQIHEMEWMRPDEILAHKPADFHKPGFIPFAFTGGGDEWCWCPAMDPKAVVSCPRDDSFGTFDAPDFLGSIYRRCLDAALELTDCDTEDECRGYYTTCITKLARYFPPARIESLQSIAKAPILQLYQGKLPYRALLTRQDHDKLVAQDLAFPRLNEEFVWMTLE